jgi:hypothetical protein
MLIQPINRQFAAKFKMEKTINDNRERKGYIYVIENMKNKKKYIGQTIRDPETIR